MNVDMLLSLSSDTQSNIKMASSKSDSNFLSVLDLELSNDGLESIVNEEEKVDEQVLQILSLLLTKINTYEKVLDEKETTDTSIKNETKENSEIKKLKEIVLELESEIQSNIKVESSKSELDYLEVLDNKRLEYVFEKDTKNSELLNELMSVKDLYVNNDVKNREYINKISAEVINSNTNEENNEFVILKDKVNEIENDNDNKTTTLSNDINKITENLDINNDVENIENIEYIKKAISEVINSNINEESNELATLKYKLNKTENDNKINTLSNNITNIIEDLDINNVVVNREHINKVINEVINSNKNENKINTLSNNINIIENLDINNDVENIEYINKVITKVINKNVNKENYDITKLNTTREILFEVNKLKESISYNNEFLESNSDEVNILNNIAFSENNNKNIQLQKSIIRNKYELDNEVDLVNAIKFSSNNSDIQFEELYIEKSVIREQNVTKDIVQTINYIKKNNIEELSVKMNPKELGEINIKLLKIKGEEKCVITLSNEDTFNLLKDNINEIKSHLSILDIKVKEISIEIRNENKNDFSDSLNQNSNKDNTKEEKKKSNKVIIEDIDNYLDNDDININLLV